MTCFLAGGSLGVDVGWAERVCVARLEEPTRVMCSQLNQFSSIPGMLDR